MEGALSIANLWQRKGRTEIVLREASRPRVPGPRRFFEEQRTLPVEQ